MESKVPIFVVVDDEEPIRMILSRYLKGCFAGAEVNVAGNPEFALVVIEELIKQDKRPDLVFTDFNMSPHGTGLSILELCKGLGVPAVLVCSDKQEHRDFHAARELAGENFIEKPVGNPEKIKAMADKILGTKVKV